MLKTFRGGGHAAARYTVLALIILFGVNFDPARGQTPLVTYTQTTALTISSNIAVPASAGTTYSLTKYSPGKLTLQGQITGGAGSLLQVNTQTQGDTTTVIEFAANNSGYVGNIQLWRGVAEVDNPLALGTGTIHGGANNGTVGDLLFNANMTFTNPVVLDYAMSVSSSNYSGVVMSGAISGGNVLEKYGTGTLTLSNANSYTGGTIIGGSGTPGGTLAIGVNNGLPAGYPLTIDNRSGASVLGMGAYTQNLGAITLYAGSAIRTIITGAGTLRLAGNLTLVDSHTSSQDYPLIVAAPIDLNGATRTFTVGYGNNQDTTDLGDLRFNGVIMNSSGVAGVTIAPYNTYNGSVTFSNANTYNGPTTLTTSSGGNGTTTLALGVNNAFPNNSAFVQSAATVLDLTEFGKTSGISTGMGSLTGAGTITLGSAGSLAIGYDNTSPAAYSGVIGGGASSSITKTGTGLLTLAGANTYGGTTIVNGGNLQVNGSLSSSNAVTVNSGGTLNGTGTINGTVAVAAGGTLGAGAGAIGTLTLNKTLTLAANSTNVMRINKNSGVLTSDTLSGMTGVTFGGTIVVTATGNALAANDTFTLFNKASGSYSGNFASLNLPALSAGLGWNTANLSVNGTISVISTIVANSVTWVGTPTNNWDLLGSNVWVQTGSVTPASYADPDATVFDDTAVNFSVTLPVAVQPSSVVFSNNVNNYTVNGLGSISNSASLLVGGNAKVTLGTSNNYTGNTTVAAGTLVLGASGAIPGGPGNGSVTVNGTLDVAGFSPVVNALSGTGTVDDGSAGGSPVVSVYDTVASTFSGNIKNTSGVLSVNKLGAATLTLAGSNSYSGGTTLAAGALSIVSSNGLGTGPLAVTENLAGATATFLTVATNGAATLNNNISLPSASGTYALTKNQTGQLTLGGTISGGGPGLILRASTDTAGDTTTVTEFAGYNTFTGGLQTYRGVVQIDNANSLGTATVYADANNSSLGDLLFNANMTFANPVVLQAATSLSSGTSTVTLSGGITGSATVTTYGSGTLNLFGNLAYNGGLVVSAGTTGIGSLILAGDTTSGGGLGATYTNYISIAAGATVQSSGTLSLYESSSSSFEPYIGVTGAGTLALTGVNNNANSPDISFAPNDTIANGTANWGARIAAPVNLGNLQRYIWGRTDHTSVDVYGLQQADCQFAGPISGQGGLTFIAQNNSSGSDSQLMETPFCLNATNTFTGPVQIQRGSVYIGTNNAFPPGNVLQFNVASGNNGKFFLYGHNTTVSDLSSAGAGAALIANGNRNPSPIGPATLTIVQNNPETYSGTIIDTNAEYVNTTTGATTTLALVKSGPAALTLNGSLAFSGPMTVTAGKVYINAPSTGGGAMTVSNGATLGGTGAISAQITVSNTGALEAGAGSGVGTLSVNKLTLGATLTDAVTLNFDANPSGVSAVSVVTANGLTNNATVTVNVLGVFPASAPAVYTLVSYSGSIKGSGTFVLGTVPDLAVAYLTNNTTASAIQLVVSSLTIPSVSWVGYPVNTWDLLGENDWKLTGTTTPAPYADFDQVVLDDTASNFVVNLTAAVSPNGVLVSNSVNNYTVTGTGSISNYTALTKTGSATVTMSVSNNYSGATTISAGTLSMGVAGALPSGPAAGNVTVNGALDVGGFSPAVNNLSGFGVVDNLSAGGSPVLTLSNTAASMFTGSIQNSSGTLALVKTGPGTLSLGGASSFSGGTTISNGILQVGIGGTAGSLGTGAVNDYAMLAFDRTDNFTFSNNVFGTGAMEQNGTGVATVSGNLTYTGPTIVNAGTLDFPNDVTFDAGTGSTLTIAAGAVMQSDFVLSLNGNISSTAIDISGAGTTRLASAIDRIESYPDLFVGANNSGVSTANYGIRLASALDLGSIQRLVWAISSRDDVTTFGLSGCDFQFAGTVSGAAELSLLGKNSWPGVNTMEEQFAFTASNTFTGPLEVLRGSVYLGNAHALTSSNVLILDPAASVNSRLFLYGYSASISDLQSGGYGTTVIANGNNVTTTNVGPATLTVTENNPTTFTGNIVDWYTEYTAPTTGSMTPTLSLVKSGPAALTLTGSNSYSGTTVISGGTLYINGQSAGAGAMTVNSGATLGGNGTISNAVTVQNGGAIQTGDATGSGTLTVKSLALGTAGGNTSVLNLAASAELAVRGNNGLTVNGGANSATINVGGTIASVGAVPLIAYTGTLGGAGFGGFQLGATPAGVTGYLSNDTAHSTIDFVATLVTIPRWSGALSPEWSANVLPAPKNWVLDSDGATQIDYVDGENVKFDDTAVSTTVNISAANVLPLSVSFNNAARNYTVTGAYGIAGTASLTLQSAGKVTLSAADSYTGATTVSSGTLALGAAGALPGGAGYGNLTVNGTLDVGGFSPVVNNLTGSGVVDNATAGGAPVLTVSTILNSTFAGAIKNTTGALGLTVAGLNTLTLSGGNTYSGPTVVASGGLTVNGSLAAGGVTVQNGAALGGSGSIAGHVALATGSSLNLTANSPLSVGTVNLGGTVTVNVAGSVSTSSTATYVLLNHAASSGSGSYLLAPVPGILNSGYTATLNDTTNQLQLIVAPTQPTGTIADVRHVVIFMQENRSFDHYFGSLHGVHGFSDHNPLTFQNGNSDFYQPTGSSYELPFHTTVSCITDLAHDWSSTHSAWDGGKWDNWISSKGTETMAYYTRSDLPYYYALADAFTICDEYHCSTMTSTDPNRLHLWTGMIDPNDKGGGPVIDNTEPSAGWGTNWITYPQRLQKAGVSWKVYQATDNYDDNALAWFAAFKQATAGNPLYDNGMTFVNNLVSGFGADVTNNTLPSVSWIVGPDNGSEHPYWSPASGEALTKQLLDALAGNPAVYKSTVFILNYDENDGFFDHGVPITPPTGTTNEFVGGLPIGLGVRVPCIIISPWSRGGYVCSQVFDHTSVIRFLEKWTGVQEPNISAWRRQVCGDLTSALDFAHPNTNYPTLAGVSAVNCNSGTTASPPGNQSMPSQEAGTLLERPLPYQPNAVASLDCGTGNVNISMTNTGTASVHFSVYPNAYRTDGPWPFDVMSSNTATTAFSTTPYSGDYDFSCYGPNGFLRRFAGNIDSDCGQIESVSYLDPYNGGFKITLANPGGSAVVFSVSNAYYANSLATYTVPAHSTNVVGVDTTTNNGWYDLITTASSDPLFVRRFAGHLESNLAPAGLVSSENPSGFRDNVTLTANFVGYSAPTGTVQFKTNGVAWGAPVNLSNGSASFSTALLPRGANLITAEYSGDTLNSPATNSLVQNVLNHPPVPGTAIYTRANNISLKIAIADLLTNVTDADGDPITLVGVGTDGLNLTTTNGTTVFTNSTYIFYTNSVAPNVNDSFEYTVSDGQGGVSVGTVLIEMNNSLVGQSNPSLILSSTTATAVFFGVPGYQYAVDRSTNLTPGAGLGWVSISTNIAPASGIMQVQDNFHDLGITVPPLPPTTFYRLRYNP
jgi:phospholipase C